MTPEAFQAATGVSDQAVARLVQYLDLLRKWQARINLVGASTLDDPWRRHLLDAAQLLPHLSLGVGPVVDMGAGAGIPGLILAACGVADVSLIESNARKGVFLREAARLMAVDVTVHAARVESVSLPRPAAVVTARALAPLTDMLGLATRFAGPGTRCLFLKGQDVVIELTEARKSWNMSVQLVDSLSDPSGRLVVVEEFAHV